MRALVVGAGIGGLTTALMLRGRGVATDVVERVEHFGDGGYVVALWRNGMRVLEQAGVADRVKEAARVVPAYAIGDEGGRTLGMMALDRLNARHGALVQIHRGELHRVLRDAVGREHIEMGTTVLDLSPDGEGASVVLSNGSRRRYDLVIGADGMRSRIRTMVFGEHPRLFGGEGWAFLAPADAQIPEGITELWGAGRYFGIYRFERDRCGVYCASGRPRGAMLSPTRRHSLRRAFTGAGGFVPRLLDGVGDVGSIFHHRLEEVVMKRWTRGPIALLGDAAHAMLPFGGMGASMAMEDAVVLVDELVRSGRRSPPHALRRYERRRRRRVSMVQLNARLKGAAMLKAGAFPLRVRTKLGICPDPVRPFSPRHTWQERVLDGFLSSSP